MQFVSKYSIVALALGALSAQLSLADPSITSVEMPKIKDALVTLTGTGFGEFNGSIISWDNFEQNAAGTKINNLLPVAGHKWQALYGYAGMGIVVDETRSVSGSKALKLDWGIDKNTIRAFGWYEQGPYNQVYISYWRWMEGDFKAESSNHKQFYIAGSASNPSEKSGFPQLMPLMPGGTDVWGVYNNVGDGTVSYSKRNNINTREWKWSNTSSKFQRWEFFFKLNEPFTESNGVVQAWIDGAQGINVNDYRIAYVDYLFTDFSLGHMAQGFPETAKAWFDDIYIATTPARVELCNSAVYTSCTKKHIQYVNSADWKPTTITFKFHNLKAFKGDDVYAYVVDSNGNVSTGYKLPKPKPPQGK